MRKKLLYAILLANIMVTITFWWEGSHALIRGIDGTLIAFGRLWGLLAELTILLQLILISRIRLIEQEFGFDKLNRLHRTVGKYIASLIILHPLSLTIGYAYANNAPIISQFLTFLTDWQDVLKAFLGLLLLVTLVVLSLSFSRPRMKYETWHVSHLLMYGAIALIFWHQVNTADVSHGAAYYYWYTLNFSVFGALVAYRFIHPFVLFYRHRFSVEKVVEETHNVCSIYIGGRHLERFTFDSGQYLHVLFMTKGFRQPHPFSISKAFDGKGLRISPKNLGDFTARVRSVPPGTKVLLEGPFGKFTQKVAVTEKFLLIAGGIGITPLRALAESLSHQKKDVVLLFGNRSPEDIVFKAELEALNIPIHHILSEKDAGKYERGYIDEEKIQRLVPDFLERDSYVCGPPPMVRSIIAILERLTVARKQIHFELFNY